MRFWLTLNMLSIDIAIGAVVGCAFFGHIFAVTVLPHTLIALGLSVWVIYTADHLMDAYKLTSRGVHASTARHRFHQQHFTGLLLMVIAASCIIGLSMLYTSPGVWSAGMLLAIPVACYLILQHKLKLLKEFSGALLYTCGIVVAPLTLLHRQLEFSEIALITLYGLTVLANLLLFSLGDYQSDTYDHNPSIATSIGVRKTRTLFFILAVINFAACLAFLSLRDLFAPVLIILSMNCILAIICVSSKELSGDRYRLIADSIFFIPFIGLWL